MRIVCSTATLLAVSALSSCAPPAKPDFDPAGARVARTEIQPPSGWTRDQAIAWTPPNVAVFRHPLGGRLAIGLLYDAVTVGTVRRHFDALLNDPDLGVTGRTTIDPLTLVASWQRESADGTVVARGMLAVGPVPGLSSPIIYVYRGEWPPDLDQPYRNLFLRSFDQRVQHFYYLP